MIDEAIRNTSLHLLVEAIRHQEPAVRAKLAEALGELQYLHRTDTPVPGEEIAPSPDSRALTSAQLTDTTKLLERFVDAATALRIEIARLHGDFRLPIANRILRVTFAVSGLDVAAGSQGSNFNKEKVNLAWRQALSMWTAVAPLEFQPPLAGEEPRLHIRFIRDSKQSAVLGTASGFISSTPAGLVGGATVTIDCDNELFLDAFLEPDRNPVVVGPFDFVLVLAHEIGHALGLDHPPIDPTTGRETEFGVMSRSIGNGRVGRTLLPFDIREVQRLHGAIRVAETVKSDMAATGQLIDASPGVTLQKGSFGMVAFGPVGTRTFLDVLVPAKGRLINALRLRFRTVTTNVFVNRAETFDGIVPVQQFAVSARTPGLKGLTGELFDLRLGFLSRRTVGNDMIVRLHVHFARGNPQEPDFGVIQVEEIAVETLARPLTVDHDFTVAA
jgi:hypothetical protein